MATHKAPFYTQAGLAAAAGLTRNAVNMAIRRGLIPTVETIDGVPLVARADAERWLKDRRQPGRPSK
jgi:hypothetical protein